MKSVTCFLLEYILKCYLFLWCKAEFSASSVLHDPSEIILICWFDAQETFLIIINAEKVCCLIFLWILWYVFQHSLINRKNSIYLKKKYFVINIFTVTFDQFDVSLLNKNINLFLWNLSITQTFIQFVVCITQLLLNLLWVIVTCELR